MSPCTALPFIVLPMADRPSQEPRLQSDIGSQAVVAAPTGSRLWVFSRLLTGTFNHRTFFLPAP